MSRAMHMLSITRAKTQHAGLYALVACCIIACALLLCAAPAAFADESTSATLDVSQVFKSNASGYDGKVTYRLEPTSDGAPMPAGAQDGVYTFTMDKNGSATISIDLDGMERNKSFTYKLAPTGITTRTGYTYDDTPYFLEAMMMGNGEAVMVVRYEDGEKPAKVEWEHAYKADETPRPTPNTPDEPSGTTPGAKSSTTTNTPATSTAKRSTATSTPATSTAKRSTFPVKTGDVLMVAPFIVLVCAAGAAAVVRRRRRGDEEGES